MRENRLARAEPAIELAYQKFLNLVPANVEVLYEQLVLHDGVLNDVQGKLDLIVSRAAQFADQQKLDGLIFPGAPREVLNPTLFGAFSAALKIPGRDGVARLGGGAQNFFGQASSSAHTL